MNKSMLWALLILWAMVQALFAADTQAQTLSCGGNLISVGDHRFKVRSACGEPDLIMPVAVEIVGSILLLPYDEVWYYNPGPGSFIRQLRFRNTRLSAIELTGYGFHPAAPGPCRIEDLRQGMTQLELVARCGDPDDREQHVRWLPSSPAQPFQHGRIVITEEWIYAFGPNRFYRALTLVDGLVVRIDTEDRMH